MLGSTLTIARNTFVESIRQPVFFIIVLLSGLLQVLNTWLAGFSMGYHNVPGEVTGDNKLLFDIGLSTVFVCGLFLAAFIATAVLSREIENKTILTIVAKPVGRPSVVIGKYLGVAGAMLVAIVLMITFLMLAIRHGVLSTAADDPDQPVIYFALIAVSLSFFLAGAGNYTYGWPFGQTVIMLLTPLLLLAYLGVLLISKKWHVQAIGTDFKPQLLLACASLAMALLVLTAIATAASTRLGQVMTITVCTGVFALGLLSNYFIGRHVFRNHMVGEIVRVQAGDENQTAFNKPGDEYVLELKLAPEVDFKRGDPIYWGPSPNGAALSTPRMTPPGEKVDLTARFFTEDVAPAVVVTGAEGNFLSIKQIGHEALPIRKPPGKGDFLFPGPTKINEPALVAWTLVPNMHFFWTVDAITQAQTIPLRHVTLIMLYGLTLIVACLSVAVILFQGRDVG